MTKTNILNHHHLSARLIYVIMIAIVGSLLWVGVPGFLRIRNLSRAGGVLDVSRNSDLVDQYATVAPQDAPPL